MADERRTISGHRRLQLGQLILAVTMLAVWSAAIFTGPRSAAAPFPEPAGVTVLVDHLPVRFPVAPFISDGVTMVPLRAIAETLGATVTWRSAEEPIECAGSNTSIKIRLGTDQALVNDRPVNLPKAPVLVNETTMVPLRFFSEAMGFQVTWDGKTSTANVISPRRPMEVWGFYALGSEEYSSWKDLFGARYPSVLPDAPVHRMAGAILGWFAVNADGTISSAGHPSGYSKPDGWPAVLLQLRAASAKALAMFFADNSQGQLSQMLANPFMRERLAYAIAAASREYDGVVIDFEGLGPDEAAARVDAFNFNLFLDSLRRYSGPSLLGVALPPLNGHFQGYDHKYVGTVADLVILMAYGYEDPDQPTPTAPWDLVDAAISMEKAVIPNHKILLGIPAYGTLYRTENSLSQLLARPAARDKAAPATGAEERQTPDPERSQGVFRPEFISNYLEWTHEGVYYQAFAEDNYSLKARVNLAKKYNLRGVALWRLGLLADGWWDTVLSAIEPSR